MSSPPAASTRRILTSSRRIRATWIEYYLRILCDCYQRRGNRQAYLQDTNYFHSDSDTEKHNLVHHSTNVWKISVRLLIALAALMRFDVRTEDFSHSYLQSASKLLRGVYHRPYKHFQAPAEYELKLDGPLYGLSDSRDYWRATFAELFQKNMRMQTVACDMSSFYRRFRNQLLSHNWLKKVGEDSKLSHVNKSTCISLLSTSIDQITASMFINVNSSIIRNRYYQTETSTVTSVPNSIFLTHLQSSWCMCGF